MSSQPEVEVVVGEQNGGEAEVVPGLVVLEPEYLPRREAGEYRVTRQLDDPTYAAEALDEPPALLSGARVIPELRGAYDLPRGVEGDEAVLLPGDSYALNPV